MLESKYRERLKSFKTLPPSNIPKMHEEMQLIKDSNGILSELFNVIISKNQYYGIRWLIGLERYVQDQKKKVPRRFTKNVSRGHIVQVELFGHFNKELTFLHPAVVLYDNNKGQLLVAPISTSKYKDNDPLHVDVEPADGLHHGSGVCLESIRGVDKNRVLFQYNKDGKNAKLRTEVLNKIDLTIMEYFLPHTFNIFRELEESYNKKQEQLNEELKKYVSLEEELKEELTKNIMLRENLDEEQKKNSSLQEQVKSLEEQLETISFKTTIASTKEI